MNLSIDQVVNNVFFGDNAEILPKFPDNFVDLVVTSPPYDDLRNYGSKEYSWDIDIIATELKRILVNGGVVVWVVGDQVINGSETGSSFRQALKFMEHGFLLHDTQIYRKLNFFPLTHNRYEQEFEYMFVFSKGPPKTFNPILTKATTIHHRKIQKKSYKFYNKDGVFVVKKAKKMINNGTKLKGNIFEYHPGRDQKDSKVKHPAVFPLELAVDQIKSWTNKNDIVLDMFSGSGTTIRAARSIGRRFVAIEKNKTYHSLSERKSKVPLQKRIINDY